ncbi:MAG TPA: Mrp/NBP35 family ATP-binding protein [Firmicutes bacterium]|nr:Mrp/NBP35 family ATP-binding protein [Bacillota bacterium]
MSDCTHDCSTCSRNCSSRDKSSFIKPLHEGASVRKTIAVASGKGGVGKSLVTSLLAVRAMARGYRTAILDADITGPSVPKAFGTTLRATGDEGVIYPVRTMSGLQLMSMNSLLEHDDDPVVWRGTLIAGAAVQFWTDVLWEDVDIMFIDMPPGTGDVPLSVFQSIPLSGIIVVTTPQDLVEMIVKKAVNMAKMMHVPVLGLVENMSYFTCPDCGKRHEIFGKSKAEELAKEYGIPAVARMPIDPEVARLADAGKIAQANTDALADVFLSVEKARGIGDYSD